MLRSPRSRRCFKSVLSGTDVPRYFFDLHNGAELPDLKGTDCVADNDAFVEATRLAGEILREMPERFSLSEEWEIVVTNSHRKKLFSLKMMRSA